MAFFFITGVMGSGKSYFGTELCIECLKQGGTVHTNLPLKMGFFEDLGYEDRVVKLPGDPRKMVYEDPDDKGDDGKPKLKSDFLVMGQEGAENVVVIDEAALEFDADSQMDKNERERNKPIFKLVALCRHAGLDLYFISQSSDNVHAKLRRMAEQRIKCVKTERLPVVGWLLVMMPWFGTFLRIYYQGQDKTPMARTWHRWRKDVGEAYDTHGMRVGLDFKQGASRKKGTETTQAKGKLFAAMVGCLLLFLVAFGYLKGSKAYGEVKQQTSSPKGTEANAASAKGSELKPQTAVNRAREWAEWSIEDEHVINSVIRGFQGVKVHTATAGVLAVGGSYQGEQITSYSFHAGWHYFKTSMGRYVVARPRTDQEKHDARFPPKERDRSFREHLLGDASKPPKP